MSDLTDFLLARIAEDEDRLVHESDWRDAINYAIRELAAIYADHPDYREQEWAL